MTLGQIEVGHKIKQNYPATHQKVISGLNLCQFMCNFYQKLEFGLNIDLNQYLSLQYLILIYGHKLIDLDLTFNCHIMSNVTKWKVKRYLLHVNKLKTHHLWGTIDEQPLQLCDLDHLIFKGQPQAQGSSCKLKTNICHHISVSNQFGYDQSFMKYNATSWKLNGLYHQIHADSLIKPFHYGQMTM